MAVPNGTNDPVRRRGVCSVSISLGVETKMELITAMIIAALYCVCAAKKKPVFGQMTLKATKALEYLKTTTEPITKNVTSFLWVHKIRADVEDWELPSWVMENDKYDWVCICMCSEGLPFLIYQKSALREIEAHLMKLEADGATIKMDKKNMMTVDLGDDSVDMSLWRNPNGGKFAPFNVDFPK